jgi:outer membrane protein assembly factor BamB
MKAFALTAAGMAIVFAAPHAARPEPVPSRAAPDEAAVPWGRHGSAQPFARTCFAGFPSGAGLSPRDAGRWLSAVEGLPFVLSETNNGYGRATMLKGVARLKAPWPADAVLRLSLASSQPVKLYFWRPKESILLCYYPEEPGRSWAAYRSDRRPGQPIVIGQQLHVVVDPALALLATDSRRGRQTAAGTYQVRHQNGSLVMTKGDVRLLTVPMAEPPAEVYFEGESLLLRDIALFRGEPAPDDPVCHRTVLMRSDRPAVLPWQESDPTVARLERLGDRGVELRANNAAAPAWAYFSVVRPGLYEVTFRLEDPLPGAGVYLGDDRGRPLQGIGFFRDPRTGRTCFGYDRPDVLPGPATPNLDAAPTPFAGRQVWLRLVGAGGTLRCFVSGDGEHWGLALPPAPNVAGGSASVGLYVRPQSGACGIKLRGIEIRSLDGIASLASIALQERAAAAGFAQPGSLIEDLGAWQQEVWASQPADAEPAAWRRACAVVTLTAGCPSRLANALLDGLLDDALSTPLPADARLKLLDDVAWVYDAWSADDARRLLARYDRFGRALLREGNRGFDVVRRAEMAAPLWTQNPCADPLAGDLARDELIALAYNERWGEVSQLCAQLRFWNQPAELNENRLAQCAEIGRVVGWAETFVAPRLPDRQSTARQTGWQHPLLVRLSKEAYNVQAELYAALEQDLCEPACQVLASADVRDDAGLVVDMKDRRLFTAFPVAVALAIREHPKFQQAMNEAFDTGDRLRLHRAIAECDVHAIERIAVQYYGTPAATEAHGWLGDRLMAGGEFLAAIGRYRESLRSAPDEQRDPLAARLRLAGAMLGRDLGEPVTRSVDFCGTHVAPAQFEELVAAMRAGHADGGAGEVAGRRTAASAAARLEARPWAKFEGDAGVKPDQVPSPARALDWPARQLAAVAARDTLIAANRSQVVAYATATGEVKWTCTPGNRQGAAPAVSLVPLRPLVVDGRVFAVLSAEKPAAELVCLDLESGNRRWTGRQRGRIVSEPLWVHGQLFVLTADAREDELTVQLTLTELDPGSGDVLGEHPLAEFGSGWSERPVCQATVVDEKIIAVAAGVLLSFDVFGRVGWVREQLWFPQACEPDPSRQYFQPPLVAGGRVWATQPGVRCIECVDVETGRLCWRLPAPELRRLLELAGDRLLIETDDGISAVSAETGREIWRRDAANVLDGYLPGGPSGLMCVERSPLNDDLACPTIVWLDTATGRTTARAPLRSLAGRRPMLGPMVADGARTWCFVGVFDEKGALEPRREICELVAAGPPETTDATTPSVWGPSSTEESLHDAARLVLPGWMLYSGSHDKKTGLLSEFGGKQDVLVTRADETAVRLARPVDVHKGNARLVLEVAQDPGGAASLEVHAGRVLLRQWTVRTASDAAPWQRIEIDLSSCAGQRVWITVVQRSAGAPAYMYWKRLETIL